jgi:uncharacterized protein (DUF427 family)
MGLSWQQGPLSSGPVGRFLTPDPLPARLLYAEPLRRRMRVVFDGRTIVDSEDVVLLHEPGHYPVAFFSMADIEEGALDSTDRRTAHRELGETSWFTVVGKNTNAARAAWQYTSLPGFADILRDRVAFAWRAMDAFYEEDERILGHAADPYHRIDIRNSSRHLVVKAGATIVAETHTPVALYESGFAPRWYVPRDDVTADLIPRSEETFCPYKGLASYWDVEGVEAGAWGYPAAFDEVARIRGLISFEPDKVDVSLDGVRLHLAPGQTVIAHGIDRGLDPDEMRPHTAS